MGVFIEIMFKKLGNANIYSWFAVMLPMVICPIILFFGYTLTVVTIIVFSILGINILLEILRLVFLLNNKSYATKKRAILESCIFFISVLLTCLLTNSEIEYTLTGFTISQNNFGILLLIFVPLYLVMFIIRIKTNQKIGKDYLAKKKEMERIE